MKQYLEEIINAQIVRFIFSNPLGNAPAQKIVVRPVILKGKTFYQFESFKEDKVYHQNISDMDLLKTLEAFSPFYKQVDVETLEYQYHIKVSKKGKIFLNKREEKHELSVEHNRQKQYLLPEGIVIPVLVDLGIMNADGTINKRRYDKYRQINRFVEMVDDALKEATLEKIHIVDFGSGKSYLTFVLYHYLEQVLGKEVNMVGIDLKEDVMEECNILSEKYGYKNLKFYAMDIDDYQSEAPVDMVISLHACDTATDIAIYKGIQWGAKIMLNVPCCQHEVNNQIETDELSLVTRYGLIQERTSALLTDALRANLIGLCDYDVQVLEFIDMEHSPKNILLRSVKKNRKDKERLYDELRQLFLMFHLNPKLYELLKEGNYVAPIS